MTESPGYIENPKPIDPKEFEHLEPAGEVEYYEPPQTFEPPEDFEPDDDFEDEHSKEEVGGVGGIVNYDEELAPEGWEYVEGESSPPADELKPVEGD